MKRPLISEKFPAFYAPARPQFIFNDFYSNVVNAAHVGQYSSPPEEVITAEHKTYHLLQAGMSQCDGHFTILP